MGVLKLGVGGPVGSGKTALVAELCRRLSAEFEIAAVTNDIYTREDAEFLQAAAVLPEGRVVGVETGGCPHTAIRDDVSMNLERWRGWSGGYRGWTLSSSRAVGIT